MPNEQVIKNQSCCAASIEDAAQSDFIVVNFVGIFAVILGRAAEVANGFAQAAAYFRQFARAKDDQNDHQNDYQLRYADTKHIILQYEPYQGGPFKGVRFSFLKWHHPSQG